MTASLPRMPSLEHLKKQAKQLLAAQRHGRAQSCPLLRRLRRFSGATDAEILAAQVTLAEAQTAVAMHYGFATWNRLREDVRSRPVEDVNSLAAVVRRCPEEIPQYAGAGVPLAVVAALNHAGVAIGFMEFAAASGWAFSFGYKYDDVSAAYMGVRGDPRSDGPFEVFAFLPLQYGFDYEMARTGEPEELWSFVWEHVDAGIPVMSEHMDGGLITAYREREGRRQLFFDGTVAPGWIDVDGLQPYAVYSLVRHSEARPRDEILHRALARAVEKGSAEPWRGTPQGLAALREYLADVGEPAKDFDETAEWLCWAAFERLMARRCCEVWLRTAASQLDGEARDLVAEAAARYGEAFRYYDQYRAELVAGEPTPLSLTRRARPPERIPVIVETLERGISAEATGLELLGQAVTSLGRAEV